MTSNRKFHEVIVGGAGIFGLTSAIELRKRGYDVAVMNPETIPHFLGSSTDISKAVRMEYGSDIQYFEMAEESIRIWTEWNKEFGEELYCNVGFLMLGQEKLDSPRQAFESTSLAELINHGYKVEQLSTLQLETTFPAFKGSGYEFGIFNQTGGFAKSGRAVEVLAEYALSIGVHIYNHHEISELIVEKHRVKGLKVSSGQDYSCDHFIAAMGAHTPMHFAELKHQMKITGHSVFWLKPKSQSPFRRENMPVFTADISNTGWYGFPLDESLNVVKIGLHANGEEIHPISGHRIVHQSEIDLLMKFIEERMPSLKDATLVYTRKCLYTDTLDGNYWIDHHPSIQGVTIVTGGSGHGFKMGPVIGQLVADLFENKKHPWLTKFKWRDLSKSRKTKEDARHFLE